VIKDFLHAVASSVFGLEDSPLSVGNEELGIRMFAIGEQGRTAAALFHPLAVFAQNKRGLSLCHGAPCISGS